MRGGEAIAAADDSPLLRSDGLLELNSEACHQVGGKHCELESGIATVDCLLIDRLLPWPHRCIAGDQGEMRGVKAPRSPANEAVAGRRGMPERFHDLMAKLVSLEPGSRPAEAVRAAAEHQLMRVVTGLGLPAVLREISGLKLEGYRLELVCAERSLHRWRGEAHGRRLRIQTNTSRAIKSAGVFYETYKVPRVGPRRRELYRRHDRFYALYQRLGRDRRKRLSQTDRIVLHLGDLEADVNNGGFEQYVLNKGRRRAASVVRQLRTIGARRTAQLLVAALAASDRRELDQLDAAFHRQTEDLASVVVLWLDRQESRRRKSD
jgi:hypothetical protein